MHCRTEQNQKIRFTRNVVVQLCIDQVRIDLLLSNIALLGHLGQCARQVDDGVAAVVFGEEEDGKMLAFFPFEVIVCTLRRRVGRRVGG